MSNSKNNNILSESGIRGIKDLAKRYKKAKIFMHQDLDGVTTALSMKEYLKQHGIETVDAEVIQYGDKEWAIKKPDARGDVMQVLVDFSKSKPMYHIHTDHHDSQAGVEPGTATSFKHSRSNVETISQTVSPKELFMNNDLLTIQTVDSANFLANDVTIDEVINYLFRMDKDKSLQKNKMMMGLVCNKLLLAFKNKPGFLEELVMKSTPSMLNILLNIKRIMLEKGWTKPEMLQKNRDEYIKSMKNHPNVNIVGDIIVQYGGGNMMKPGSYDRYTPFKNNPDAEFIVIAWPLGLVQSSVNPFKKDKKIKGVNLIDVKDEVLSKWEGQLKTKDIPLSTIKWVSEVAVKEDSVGYTFKDFVAMYGNKFKGMENGREFLRIIGEIMLRPFNKLTEKQIGLLDKISVNAWDLIQTQSGGHPSIVNISGLIYLGRPTRPPQKTGSYKREPGDEAAYVKFTKMIQNEFVRVLQEKINEVQ